MYILIGDNAYMCVCVCVLYSYRLFLGRLLTPVTSRNKTCLGSYRSLSKELINPTYVIKSSFIRIQYRF